MINLHNIDCMKFMADKPDNCYDLAITDPDYGIGETWKKNRKGVQKKTYSYKNLSISSAEYFKQLFRISKEWFIFGSNYYTKYLPPSNKIICWDKSCTWEKDHKSEFELAQTSITSRPATIIRVPWSGCRKGTETGIKVIHPHQKPLELYMKVLKLYAKKGWKILETHGGSMSIAIACYVLKFDLDICEKDKHYFEVGKKRYEKHISQVRMF